MGHEISSWLNVSPGLLTEDQTLCLSLSLSLSLSHSPSLSVSIFFSLCLADLCISLQCLCLCSLWKKRGEVCTQRWGGTPAQSHLGRERAECHQEPPLSYTWGAPAMEEGYAALHANGCREPSACHLTQGHRNTGDWLTWRVFELCSANMCLGLWFSFYVLQRLGT